MIRVAGITRARCERSSTNAHFQMELRSVGYLLRFFSSSSRASWIHSLVETLV